MSKQGIAQKEVRQANYMADPSQRKEKQMPLMAWIDYSLIVVFFALIAGLVVVISRPLQQDEAASSALAEVRQNKTAYAFLAILVLFLLSITLLSSKRPQKRAGSAH